MLAIRSLAVLVPLVLALRVDALSVHFDPTRDLPDFERVLASSEKDLYPVDAYSDLLGKEMDANELKAVQDRWKGEHDAVVKKLADLAHDPKTRFKYLLDAHLAKHKYFARIGTTVDESVPPFLLYVQNPSKDDPKHASEVAGRFGPWLARLTQSFDARVVKPLGLVQNVDAGAYAIGVLASKGDFDNAVKFLPWDFDAMEGCAYDAKLRIAVGYEDPFDTTLSPAQRVNSILHSAVDALLQGHQVALKRPGSLFLTSGLPHYLVPWRAGGPEIIDRPEPRADMIRRLADLVQDKDNRDGFLLPCAELFSIVDGEGASGAISRMHGRAPKSPANSGNSWLALGAQCALWTHYLIDGENGRNVEHWRDYAKAVMGGKSAPDASTSAFVGVDLGKLDRDFYRWVLAERRKLDKDVKIDTAVIDDLFTKPAKDATAGAPTTASAPAAPVLPPFDPASLSIGASEVEAQHGLALLRARRGDLDGALGALKAISSANPPAPYAGRVARDLLRMVAAIQLRDGWLDQLAKKNGRLNLTRDGKSVGAGVAKVERGLVYFAENKQGLTTIPLSSLDLLDVAKQTEKKEFQVGAEPWARGYLLLLAGDERWDKFVKPDSDAAKDLREDAKVWYATTLRSGASAEILDQLGKLPLPKSRAEGEASLVMVKKLQKELDLPVVALKKPALAKLAQHAITAVGMGLLPNELVHGAMTLEADGRAKLAYDFESADQALDFELQTGYLAEQHKSGVPIKLDEASSVFQIEGGTAHVKGAATWRLPVAFEAPLSIEYTWRTPSSDGELTGDWYLLFLVCDDGKGSDILWHSLGWLFVHDKVTGQRSEGKYIGKPEYSLDTDFHSGLTHDGTKVVSTLEGEVRSETKVGPRTRGGIALFVHSDRWLVIDALEIEGKLDPTSLDGARYAWIAREIAGLGF